MLESISLAFQNVWRHKLRSFLTMLGIIIGIASIITIVSTIKGTNEQIKESLVGAGNNAVVVQLYQDNYPYEVQYNGVPTGVYPITEETRQEFNADWSATKLNVDIDKLENTDLLSVQSVEDDYIERQNVADE